MHLDDGTLQEILHDEVPEAARADIDQHLAACHECWHRLSEARREENEIFGLLNELDAVAGITPRPAKPTLESRVAQFKPRRRQWAAAAVLVVGASGVLFALPDSPVRKFFAQRRQLPTESSNGASATTSPPADERMGIVVDAIPSLVVSFNEPLRGDSLRVVLTTGSQAVLRSPAGAELATRPGQLTVMSSALSGMYELQVPRSTSHVVVRVQGTDILIWNGSRIAGTAAGNEAEGWLIPILQR